MIQFIYFPPLFFASANIVDSLSSLLCRERIDHVYEKEDQKSNDIGHIILLLKRTIERNVCEFL